MKAKSQRVKQVRQATRLNQEDFAKALGVSTSIVAKVESEAASPDNLIVTISKKTGISIEDIEKGNIPSEINIVNENDISWKDEAYTLLKEELKDWKAKHAEAMLMLSKMIDRMSLGKHKSFALTANGKKQPFVAKC